MDERANADRIRRFMHALGNAATRDGIAVDIELDPEQNELLRALPAIKNEVSINVELASLRRFIPLPAGWEDRSPSAGREGA